MSKSCFLFLEVVVFFDGVIDHSTLHVVGHFNGIKYTAMCIHRVKVENLATKLLLELPSHKKLLAR